MKKLLLAPCAAVAVAAACVLPSSAAWAEDMGMEGSAEAQSATTMEAPVGSIARSAFTSAVQDREPVDSLTSVPSSTSKLIYFTAILNMEGHTVTHQWKWGDMVMAEVPFKVKGPRWRVWSTKALMPQWQGEWSVSVVDENGRVLAKDTLTVTP